MSDHYQDLLEYLKLTGTPEQLFNAIESAEDAGQHRKDLKTLQDIIDESFLRERKLIREKKVLSGLLNKAVLYWQTGRWDEPIELCIQIRQALNGDV